MLDPADEFLGLMADAQGPPALIAALAPHPEWLTPEFCAYARAALATKPWLRALESRLEEFELLIRAATLAASAVDLADFVSKSEANPLFFSKEMCLVLAVVDDDASKRVQALMDELQHRFDAVEQVGSGSRDMALMHMAIDPVTVDAFAVRARMELTRGGLGALDFFAKSQWLEDFANLRRQLEVAEASGGRVQLVARHLTSGEAEVMWLGQFVHPRALLGLVHEVRTNARSLESGLREVQRLALNTLETGLREIDILQGEAYRPAAVSRAFALATAVAAFHVVASSELGTSDQASRSLAGFRALFDSPWFAQMSVGERATVLLRFTLFVFQQMNVITDARAHLEWLPARIRDALASLIGPAHPGLRRDLRMARARALRELSIWDPTLLDESIAEFRLALRTRGARFDPEARGRGLMDLASAIHASQVLGCDSQVDGLYREALALLSPDKFPFSRSTALLGFAIALNERRTEGDQERALELLDQALDLNASRISELEEEGPRPSPRSQEQLASIHMTRGNVLRSSPELQRHEGVVSDTPLAAYLSALDVLQGDDNRTLKALLRLNMAHAYLDDAPNEHRLGLASRSLDEARVLAQGPRDLAIVALTQARLVLETPFPERGTDVPALVSELTQAVSLFTRHGDFTRAADAALKAAQLLVDAPRPAPASLVAALELLDQGLGAARLGAPALLREILVFQARLLQYRAPILSEQAGGQARRQALAKLEEAIGLPVESRLVRGSVAAALQQYEDDAHIAADIVWLEWAIGHELRSERISQALSVEASLAAPQLSGLGVSNDSETEAARRAVLLAERAKWGGARGVTLRRWFGTELEARVDEWSLALAKRHLRQPGARVVAPPRPFREDEVLLSIIVSEWGGLAIIDDARAAAPHIVPIPLDRIRLSDLLWGSGVEPGWVTANRSVGRSIDADPDWQAAFERLLTQLAESVWKPLRAAGLEIDGRVIRVVPGALRSLPLHAVEDPAGGSLISRASAWEYVSHRRERPRDAVRGKRARLVLSDAHTAAATLPSSVSEVATVPLVPDPSNLLKSRRFLDPAHAGRA